MWLQIMYNFISALTFRIRGGLRIYKDKKFPLNKWWFAIWFPTMHCLIRGWNTPFYLTGVIASRMCTNISGWGTYIGALLTGNKISETDKDDLNITDFVQNKLFPLFNKTAIILNKSKFTSWIVKIFPFLEKDFHDCPRVYGGICLSLRGGLTTFILGLWLNNIWYMPVGLLQGPVYWLGGWTCRHIYNDGKYGWKISEWYWGFTLSVFSIL